jgi:hypothetical protein
MQQNIQSPATQRVLWYLAILVGGIIAALVISFLVPPIVALLKEVESTLRNAYRRLLEWPGAACGPRVRQFFDALKDEPRQPVLARLERLDAAARHLGDRQISRLERLDNQMRDNLTVLRVASAPNPLPQDEDQKRIARAIAGGSLMSIVGLGFLAFALGGINSFLLSVFFREVLPTGRLLPYPLPDIQAGNILAIIFFIVEVSTGWMIYRNAHPQATDDSAAIQQSTTEVVFKAFPWLMLATLAIIETGAYALLSVQIGLPKLLNVPPTSAFFGILQYFFAFFGFALTCGLASIGHALADAQRRWREARVERQILDALQKRDKVLIQVVERIRQNVMQIREAAALIPDSIASEFIRVLGVDRSKYPGAPLALYQGIIETLSSPEPSTRTALAAQPIVSLRRPSVRSKTQVIADLGLCFSAALILVVVGTLTGVEIAQWVLAQNLRFGSAIAPAAGVGVPVGCIMLGVLARNALANLRHASIGEQILDETKGRRIYGIVLCGIIAGAAVLLGWLAASIGVLGGSWGLGWLLGVFQAMTLVAIGAWLDVAIVAVLHVGYLAGLALLAGVAYAIALLALAAASLTWLLTMVARLAAVPGNLMRGLGLRQPDAGVARA